MLLEEGFDAIQPRVWLRRVFPMPPVRKCRKCGIGLFPSEFQVMVCAGCIDKKR